MATINAIGSSDPIEVAKGGTGVAATTVYAVQCGGTTTTAPLQSIASVGTSGQVLTSNGAGALPTFQAAGGAGVWTYISSVTASSDATVNFEGIDSTYAKYVIKFTAVIPATDQVTLQSRIGTGAGPTYQSGAADYGWNYQVAGVQVEDQSDSQIDITNNVGSDTNEYGATGSATLYAPSNTSIYTYLNYDLGYVAHTNEVFCLIGSGLYLSTTAVTAIQFFFSSGNIESGQFDLYGISD